MDKSLAPLSDIFHTTPFDDDCHYVHLMQSLDDVSFRYEDYPLDPILVEDAADDVARHFVYLRNIHGHMTRESFPKDVRGKYVATWRMIEVRHGGLLRRLVEADFDPTAISKIDWSGAMHRGGHPDW